MVEMSKILEQVADVVRESGRVTGEIPESSDLYAEVGVESVNSIAILLALEEKFAITIDDTEFVKARPSLQTSVSKLPREHAIAIN